MWTTRAAVALIALAALLARAEPRVPGMDATLEASLARGDYVFVWDIDIATLGRGDPYRTARTYYDGLMYAVTEARRLIEPGTPANLRLEPAQPARGWDEAFTGTLASTQTYIDDAPIVLYAELTRRECSRNRAQVFYALSLEPRDTPGWAAMRKVRETIACDTGKN